MMSLRARLAIACAMSTGAMTAAVAGPTVLAPPTVFISPAETFTIYTAPGIYYNASTDSALFGIDPSVSTDYNGNDGSTYVDLTYQIELLGPGIPPATPPSAYAPTVAVGISTADLVTVPTGDPAAPRADAQIKISDSSFNALDIENCAGNLFTGCSYGGQGFTTTPIGSINQVNLVPFLAYTVELRVDTEEAGFAELDAEFSAPAGYTIAYSPGLLSAVPEPTSWVLMVLGMGILGVCLRKDRGRRMTAVMGRG